MISHPFLLLYILLFPLVTSSTHFLPYIHDPDILLQITSQLSEDFRGSLGTNYVQTTCYRVIITCLNEDGTPDADDLISIRVDLPISLSQKELDEEETQTRFQVYITSGFLLFSTWIQLRET
jgi:hypothetical protein